MKINKALCAELYSRYRLPRSLSIRSNSKGQALVEFTLVFIILVILTWIPAEFGLAFYAGQVAQNASREGARLAAASKTIDLNEIKTETCKRLSAVAIRDTSPNCAPYSNAKVDVTQDTASSGCPVTVKVTGDYNFFFYQMLRMFATKATVPDSVPISRSTTMRYEWPVC